MLGRDAVTEHISGVVVPNAASICIGELGIMPGPVLTGIELSAVLTGVVALPQVTFSFTALSSAVFVVVSALVESRYMKTGKAAEVEFPKQKSVAADVWPGSSPVMVIPAVEAPVGSSVHVPADGPIVNANPEVVMLSLVKLTVFVGFVNANVTPPAKATTAPMVPTARTNGLTLRIFNILPTSLMLLL